MYSLITILLVVVAVLIMLVVLVQNPKGGGLGAGFGGGGGGASGGGVQNTTDFLEKSTWVLAIVFLMLSLFSNLFLPGSGVQADDAFSNENQKVNEQLLDQ